MRVFKIILVPLISLALLIGCSHTNDSTTKLEYETLSSKEERLSKITHSKTLIYNLKNLPTDKNYKISIIYEVYEKENKIKEAVITSLLNDSGSEKNSTETITLSIQSNKIGFALGKDAGYAFGSCDVTEDLSNCSSKFMTGNVDLKFGTTLYLYHAMKNEDSLGEVRLNDMSSSEYLSASLKDYTHNIFIKLVYEEVQ